MGAGAMRVHARVSKRVLTLRDPYVNLLRNTVAVFAAGLGGAEAITSPRLRSVPPERSGTMCSRIQGPPASRAARSASSADVPSSAIFLTYT